MIHFDPLPKAADEGVEDTDCPSQEMKVDEESQDGPQSEEKESDKNRGHESLI
jgi:hypothetical protein